MIEKTCRQPGVKAPGPPLLNCSFAREAFAAPRGDILALRVFGDVDACSLPALCEQLEASRRRVGSYLVVDISGLTFCSVHGLAVLAAAGGSAARVGLGYALAGSSSWFEHCWSILRLDPVQRYRSLALAVSNIRADQILAEPA